MYAKKTLQNYIEQCDKIIESADMDLSKNLVNEILAVFAQLPEIRSGLTKYSADLRPGQGFNLKPADYLYDLKILRAKLQAELEKDEDKERINDDQEMNDKPNKVFISHSSQDKAYVQLLVELLEDIGMPEKSVVCTSVPGYGVPNDLDIFDWLRDQFNKCNLRVIYVLSKNYYDSQICLNEMGAAWITKTTDTLLLLPGFHFDDIKGVVNANKAGISFENDDLRDRLGQLKDKLVKEYNLQEIGSSKWERHRDEFIRKINEVAETSPKAEPDSNNSSYTVQSTMVMQNPDYIPLEVSFLVVYALKDDGVINYIKIDNGEIISAGGYNFTPTQSAREIAKWKETLDTLVDWKWVTKEGDQFKLTNTGFNWADNMKESMHIDTDKEPLEQMKEFD